MTRAADRVADASKDIADATMHASERKDVVVVATSEPSSISSGPTDVRDFDQSFQDLRLGNAAYRANLRSARASDAQFEQLLDMVIPQGYSRLVLNTEVL